MPESQHGTHARMNRRQALTLAAASALAPAAMAADSTKTAAHQAPGGCSTPRTAVARTQYGKVRGYVEGGVLTFKGVPYGQNTGGENRWLPAKPPVPWKDEYPALIYGGNCPQYLHDNSDIWQSFLQDWDDGYQSEDMLKLNIWTPSLTGRRAVMFYIHGGGFQFGSSYELPSHDGAQMARHHDVVQVSVNHRLNALGFLDVSEVGGAAYEGSVNVGMTDLVAALKWVRENIANFGGDPDRVMIYGQSGGGSKVTTLLGMESAKGLIHRASAQSGGGGSPLPREQSREFTRELLKELGIGARDIGALQKTEWARIDNAANAISARLGTRRSLPFFPGPPAYRHFWSPTLDGNVITMRSFAGAAPETSKQIPMMIGSVSEEGTAYHLNPNEAELRESVAKALGQEKAAALVAAMKKAHPGKSARTLSYGLAGLSFRNSVVRMATLKHDQKGAPVYQYYFCWQSPMLGGDAGAWHTAELAFCFDNTRRCEQGTGNTPEAQALARKMATAWANFARTGNPSQPGLAWTPSDPERNQTMVWDTLCRMVDDPEGGARKIMA